MVEILEEPSVRRLAIPISVAVYHRMGEEGLVDRKTELIRGVIIEKMGKSPLHSYLTGMLHRLVSGFVGDSGNVRREDPLTLADSEPEPDVAVVEGSDMDYLTRHPTTAKLVIEVSFSSGRLDREMAAAYAEACVQEYWIVLGLKRAIEVYRLPVGGRYQERRIYRTGEVLKSSALPGLEVALATLFPRKR